MEGTLWYGEARIRYRLRRRDARRKGTIAIHVESDGRVLVDAPGKASVEEIRRAVAKRAGWIHRHVSAARRRLSEVLPREYVSGESQLYLGRRYQLKIVKNVNGRPSVRLRGGYIEAIVQERSRHRVEASLQDWYREQALRTLPTRLGAMIRALRLERAEPAVRLRAMRVQWGSCSPSGRLTLNPSLVKAPPECIDYVLLHELCHLLERNHGRRFYALLDRHMPDWRRRKKRLDELAEQILA